MRQCHYVTFFFFFIIKIYAVIDPNSLKRVPIRVEGDATNMDAPHVVSCALRSCMVPGNRVQGQTHIAITRHGVHGAVVIKATREGRKARLKYGQKVLS